LVCRNASGSHIPAQEVQRTAAVTSHPNPCTPFIAVTDELRHVHSAGRLLGQGRDGVVTEGFFGLQRAVLKFYIPAEYRERFFTRQPAADIKPYTLPWSDHGYPDPVKYASYLENELHAYAVLEELQGALARSKPCRLAGI
jgi:hypothetical protein